jgi:hypothetical protein
MSKYSIYNDKIKELILIENSNSKIAQILLKTTDSRRKNKEVDTLRTYVSRYRNKGVVEACESLGVDNTTTPMLWLKSKEASIRVTNPLYKAPEQVKFEDLSSKLIEELKLYSPKFVKIERQDEGEGYLLVVDIADLHINKYATSELTGAEYNSKIAVKRAIEGTKGLLQKCSGFHIDKILFVIGNDVLNTDNLRKSTTKDTPQDTDSHWLDAFRIAYKCYVECIDLCKQVADVDVVHCVSNHDFMTGCLLAETLQAHFRHCKNITFDIGSSYRKYYQYYNNLIELEHGDKGKIANLPLVIAQSQPKMWANTKFRYSYLHHVHHSDKTQYQSSKDYIGINITYLRSPSSADIWHSDNSFLNMVAVEGFIHSKENGRVSHLTHYF